MAPLGLGGLPEEATMERIVERGCGLDVHELIAPQAKVIGAAPLKCRERLGGVLKFYYREAA
jgi:hypothetical protein